MLQGSLGSNRTYLGNKLLSILSLIAKAEGPTLVTLCNNQNFYMFLTNLTIFFLRTLLHNVAVLA
jgi:hypothetical protein